MDIKVDRWMGGWVSRWWISSKMKVGTEEEMGPAHKHTE